MDNLLWAAGGAAVVYVLWVRPLQRRLASESAGDAAPAEAAAGVARVAASSSSPPKTGCGCGG